MFQIRDLVSDVWLEEGDGFLLSGCTHPSCGKSSADDDDDDDDNDDQGGDKGSKPKYAPYAFSGSSVSNASEIGLALLQQQLRQSLAQEL